jgi:exosome complex exonuclease RRP6
VPLEECLKTFRDSRDREQYVLPPHSPRSIVDLDRYPHPYQSEIQSYDYPSTVYEASEPIPYQPFESTTATFVDTPEALALMLAELKTAKEIAVDLEHHDNRSYIGMVSLMQISTRDKDWIVDTLKPWRRKLECLNEVFANPDIVKVLHGAFMDIIWLQRDLGLYVVGLFDTYHAARSLGYPGGSLAYLLERFIQFKAQKQHQLADWRTRPLGTDLFEYARADTHFLLYIYDNMRNELVERSDFSDPEKNKVQDVLLKSKETALQRYENPIYDTELGLGSAGWHKLIMRTPAQFTRQQFSVFRAVHRWRDNLSRKEDESPLFIMPNHAVFSIARAMPADKPALFNAIQHVSHIIRGKADELVGVITEAKTQGIDGPELNDVLKTIDDMKEARYAQLETPKKAAAAPVTPEPSQASLPGTVTTATPASRAPASQFWGKLYSAKSSNKERPISTLAVNLALPLPPLTAEIFADTNGTSKLTTPQAEKPKHTFVPKEDRPQEDELTDLFIVKQLGGKKRKRTDALESQSPSTPVLDPMHDDEIMIDQEESEEALRAREKAAKKALKKQKKRELAAQAADSGLDQEPVFDYANAPSILHANDAEGKKGKKDKKDKDKKKKKSASFAPFSGMTDAPKGLPRAQKEKAGRSRTFKS